MRINHVGLCVRDIAKSRRFYEEVFGFTYERELKAPDEPTGKLLGIAEPVGLTAAYLKNGDFTLELLEYARTADGKSRVMNEPGLTHISFSLRDPFSSREREGVLAKVAELGGEVVDTSDIGAAVMVRDPDGQLLEMIFR